MTQLSDDALVAPPSNPAAPLSPAVIEPPAAPETTPKKRPARLEQQIVDAVHILGFIGLIVSILVAIGACVIAGLPYLYGADARMTPPNVAYAGYQASIRDERTAAPQPAADTTLAQREQEAARATAEAEFERKLKPKLDAMLENLTAYAGKIEAPKPSGQALGDLVRKTMRDIAGAGPDLAWTYVDGLVKATSDLAADGDRLSKLGAGDPHRVRWDQMVTWYYQDFVRQYRAEVSRVEAQRRQIASERSASSMMLLYAAGAGGVALVLVLLLLLFRIEQNTRPVALASGSPRD